jgi:hypothetical protein
MELAVAVGVGMIGGAGVGGLIKSLAELTRPSRLHRRMLQLRDVRDALSAGSTARSDFDQMIDDLARALLRHLANAPSRRRNTVVLVASVIAVVAGIVVAIRWGDDISAAVSPGLPAVVAALGVVLGYVATLGIAMLVALFGKPNDRAAALRALGVFIARRRRKNEDDKDSDADRDTDSDTD